MTTFRASRVVLCLLVFALVSVPGWADDTTTQFAKVWTFPGDEPQTLIQPATATLTRTDAGVGFEISVRGLTPGYAYTVWWVVFNRPENCIVPNACSLADLTGGPGGPARDSIFWGTGEVSDAAGKAHFSGHAYANGVVPGQRLWGAGVRNTSAEIHFVVRCHGLYDILTTLEKYESLTRINGACEAGDTNDGECVDVAVTVFSPPAE